MRLNFSEATINKIISMYNDRKSTVEIAKEFGCSRDTILRLLKSKGVSIRGASLQLHESDINKIISMYTEGTSSGEIANEFGCNSITIIRLLKSKGVSIRGANGISLQLHESYLKDIISMYNGGKSTAEIAKEFGCSDATILKVLKANGINIRSNRLQLKESDINKIIIMYNDGKSTVEIANEFGCNSITILRLLKSKGVIIRKGKSKL